MQKRFEIFFSDEAKNELNSSYSYYEEQSVGLGKRFIKDIDNTFESIQLSPNGFQLFNKKNNTRQIPLSIFPYVIIYKIKGESHEKVNSNTYR
jgi:hypothetical protein